ncbi:MAG: LPS export ABC transporter periplasmic protein LptC [Bacteroidetes bacterium]|nr:MAG: LPS export ABC transporter periplasmic protein LptC [Bacteroidota bacterium]
MRKCLLILFWMCMTACENNPSDVVALTRKVQEVEEGKNIKAVFSQKANLKAVLSSPLMYRVKADTPYTEFPNTLHVDFFDENARLQSVVNAKYGKYLDLLNKVYLADSVVVFNSTGDTLFCKTLWWNQGESSLYTSDSVYIHTRTQTIWGTGLWSKADFSKYTITNVIGMLDLPRDMAP